MKDFFKSLLPKIRPNKPKDSHEEVKRQIASLYNIFSGLIGSEKVVLKACKLDALELMRSEAVSERVLALRKLVFDDPTADKIPAFSEIPEILDAIEDELADMCARRTVEEKIERKIVEKMDERHQEYVKEIKMQVINEEQKSIENPQTLKKYAKLEIMEQKNLTKSAMEQLRPNCLAEIVGQEAAVDALRAKIASPYPQHLILYGPPGVGKTTAARIVLEAAKELQFAPFAKDAPFIETDGNTLRWDSRDMTNPLLGSVHDPIYQGARRDLADNGVPEPKTGLVTDAHGGILFIDEIGEMDLILLNKLLKVLENKRVFFESAYYDPTDTNIPKYIRKLFETGAPADFLLIGATTREPSELPSALRSRCAEIFFEPLTPTHIEQIIINAAEKLEVKVEAAVPAIISQYTVEGRKAISLLADAHSFALYDMDSEKTIEAQITAKEIYKVVQVSRLSPYVSQKSSKKCEIGKVFGLGVSGYLGSVIEIEAVAFPVAEKAKGSIRFNDTAGSMAKDSVFNATAVVRKIAGQDLDNYDIHVNIIGGGRIDGPSAGVAILTSIISAITKKPVRQDIAVTGEISIQGGVKAVGGVFEKAYGAKQAGINTMIIPQENIKDVPNGHLGLNICPVDNVEEALALLLEQSDNTAISA